MKLVNFRLMIPASTLGAVGEHRTQTIHRLALPRAHLVRMNLVLGRVRRENNPPDCFLFLLTLDRPVASQCFQRHPGSSPGRNYPPPENFVQVLMVFRIA